MKQLPENILKRMSPEDRRPMGKAGVTSAEAIAKRERLAEKKLHQQIAQLLNIKNIMFVHSRTDRKTTTAVGVPDFIIFRPFRHQLSIEVKVGDNQPTEAQLAWHREYERKTEDKVHIVRSLDHLKEML